MSFAEIEPRITRTLPDEQLAARLQQDPSSPGSIGAFSALYERYADHVTRFLEHRYPRLGISAEDVAQTCLIEAMITKVGAYNPDRSSWSTWVTLIASRRAVDELRKADHARLVPTDPSVLEQDSTRVYEDPARDTAYLDKAVAAVKEGVDNPDQRRALGYELVGVTNVELAALEGISLGTAKSRIRLGKQRAQEALQDAGIC